MRSTVEDVEANDVFRNRELDTTVSVNVNSSLVDSAEGQSISLSECPGVVKESDVWRRMGCRSGENKTIVSTLLP